MMDIARAKQALLFLKRDLANAVRYGLDSPRHSQTIYVDPSACKHLIDHDDGLEHDLFRSGVVTDAKFWKGKRSKIRRSSKISSILSHWTEGVPWEETSAYRWTLKTVAERPGHEGCFTADDVARRYEVIDEIFHEVKTLGRFRTPAEIGDGSGRAMGAPVFHLGKRGRPIFGGSGYHRFAVALALGVPLPSVVGTVHRSALPVYPSLTVPPPPASDVPTPTALLRAS